MNTARGKFDPRIISKPGAQPALHRSFFGVITAAFWALYLYLWLPLLTLVLWLFGIRTTIFELYLREHQIDPFLILALPLIAITATILLILWAEYNRWRFKDKERRNPQANVTLDRVAAALHATPEIAAELNSGRISILHMDQERAYPLSVTAVAPTAPTMPSMPPAPPAESRTLLPGGKSSRWLVPLGLLLIAVAVGALVLISHTYTDPVLHRPVPQGTSAFNEATKELQAIIVEAQRQAQTSPPAPTPPLQNIAGPQQAEKKVVAKQTETKKPKKEKKDKKPRATTTAAKPIPGQSPKPAYPREALRGGEGGLVVLRVTVGPDGKPTKVDFARRSRVRELDRAAHDAVMRWRFTPAVRNGKAVSSTVLVPVEFTPDR